MSHTNVKSEFVSGNLVFKDKDGAEIFTVDGANRKVSIPSGSSLDNAGTVAFTGTQTFDEIAGNDASLGITGLATTADTGGAVAITGGATTTSGVGGAVSLTGGAGSGTDAGGAASVVGGASGAGATGNGGNAAVTGGAAASTNGGGGSVVLTPGAKAGSGIAGGNFLRSATAMHFEQHAAVVELADGNQTLTAAQMINGIVQHTVTTGATLTTPTGAEISAGCPAALAVGDCFKLHVITIGTGADDISTLTAGASGVTLVGKATVGPDTAAIAAYGTWLFRNTAADTWIGYRIG